MDYEAAKKTEKVMWPQWIASFGATLLMIEIGLMVLWSSPYVAYLTSPESHIPITMDDASWVVSLLNLGRLIGAVSGSVSVNYFGSKTTILVTSLPMALCWLFTIVANRVEWLYAARFLGGISLGKTYSSLSIYLGEIADPKIRGALVVLAVTGLPVGTLIMSIMGAYLTMEISAIASLFICFILMAIFIWLPESPYHFVKIKEDKKARASILWYHRNCDVESEFQALKKFIETNPDLPLLDVLKEFRLPHISRGMILLTTLFMYTQLCGLNNVMFYMETILEEAEMNVMQPSEMVIIVTAVGIVSSAFSMLLIDRYGRRTLEIISGLAVTISMISLSTQFQLLAAGYDPDNFQGLSIFAVLLFQAAVFMGIVPIPTVVLGEIFPPHVKCVASCFGSIIAGIFSFISTSTYQPLVNLLTEKYVFYIYALVLSTIIPFAIFCMPETKGKSLQQIQEELTKKS